MKNKNIDNKSEININNGNENEIKEKLNENINNDKKDNEFNR